MGKGINYQTSGEVNTEPQAWTKINLGSSHRQDVLVFFPSMLCCVFACHLTSGLLIAAKCCHLEKECLL